MPAPSATPDPLLSASQRRLVGFALGLFAFIGTGVMLVFLFLVFAFLVGHFSGVLWPLAVAGILALMLQPVVGLLEKRLHLRRLLAVTTIYAVFVLAATALLLGILPPLIAQLLDFIAYLPTLWSQAVAYFESHYPAWIETARAHLANDTLKGMVDKLLGEMNSWLAGAIPTLKSAGVGLLHAVAFLTSLAIIPIYLFFFLLMGSAGGDPASRLEAHLPFIKPSLRTDLIFLVREFISLVVAFFRGQLLIGLIMGVLLAAGFALVDLRFALILGLTLGILNIIPYLGTIIGLSLALPLAFFQPGGDLALVGLVLLVFIAVQLLESWFLTPKIMGDSTGLHPVVIIIAIFFWGTALDGLLGMILAIPLTAFLVTAWRLAKQKWFTHLESPPPSDPEPASA